MIDTELTDLNDSLNYIAHLERNVAAVRRLLASKPKLIQRLPMKPILEHNTQILLSSQSDLNRRSFVRLITPAAVFLSSFDAIGSVFHTRKEIGMAMPEPIMSAGTKNSDVANSKSMNGLKTYCAHDMNTLMSEFLDELQVRVDHALQVQPSGYVSLDKLQLEFQRGEVAVLSASTSRDKAAQIINVILSAEDKNHLPILVMSSVKPSDLVWKLVSAAGSIDLARLIAGNLLGKDWPKLTETVEKFLNLPIHFITCENIYLRNFQYEGGHLSRIAGKIGVLLLDAECFQELKSTNIHHVRIPAVDEIGFLKEMAEELDCSIQLVKLACTSPRIT